MKNKKITIVILLVMIIGMSILLTGCKQEPKFTVDEMLKYMSDKYGEEFTYIGPTDINQPTASSFDIYVANKRFPNDDIRVRCLLDTDTGEKTFMDNFPAFIYEDQTRKLLTEVTTSVYPDAKIRYLPNDTVVTLSSNEGFEEYLSRAASSISYMIVLPPEHDETIYKEELTELCKAFKQNKIVCDVTIAYSKDDAQYENFKTNEYTYDYVVYKWRGNISLRGDFEINFEEWR